MRYLLFAMVVSCVSWNAGADSLPEVFSRNMPSNCDFVYHVESDVSIKGLSNDGASDRIEYSLLNHYTGQWTSPRAIDVSASGTSEVTLVSMSQNPMALYRIIRFWQAGQSARGQIYESEFARQFGETCYWSGREDTPFRKRQVSLVE